jgi:DNA-binding NarL/FixJ family response regulator
MEKNNLIKIQGDLIKHTENALNITTKLLSINPSQAKILYLDDHILYYYGTLNCIVKKFPNADVKHIQNGDEALKYVINCLTKKVALDLIITDIAHSGINGIDFANAVRSNEIVSRHKIPILFITMNSDKSLIGRIKKIPLVKFLSKTAPCEEINFAIETLIYPKL